MLKNLLPIAIVSALVAFILCIVALGAADTAASYDGTQDQQLRDAGIDPAAFK